MAPISWKLCGIEHAVDPLAHRQPAAFVLALDALRAAELLGQGDALAQFLEFRFPADRCGGSVGGTGTQRAIVGHSWVVPRGHARWTLWRNRRSCNGKPSGTQGNRVNESKPRDWLPMQTDAFDTGGNPRQ